MFLYLLLSNQIIFQSIKSTNICGLIAPIEKKEMEARIGAEIKSALETWMPYVTMDSIEVFSAVDAPYGTNLNENDILVRMDYTLQNAGGISDSIQLSFPDVPT